jgi:integrase
LVAGRLQEKKGLYYIILDFKDEEGKRKLKWIPTGLKVKGNKKTAEKMLMEARRNFGEPEIEQNPEDVLFSDFLYEWLETFKTSMEATTLASYSYEIKIIGTHFAKKKISLKELKAKDIQDFYTEQLRRVSANTVIHYHARIHKVLKYAVKMDLIPSNPAEKVERPRKDKYIGSFYTFDEINELFKVAKGTPLELAVKFGAFYGLRRSEIVGLKWNAIDFTNNTLTIKHTVTAVTLDGKRTIIEKDRAKNKSSLRSLPLEPEFKDMLFDLKMRQERFKSLCKKSYNKEYLDYIYVDDMGNRIKPDYISVAFPKLLNKKGMRVIRFHDLRHSCASLLLSIGVPMKQIQEWLGHSTFATTADLYIHTDAGGKVSAANAMSQSMKISV